MRITKKPARVWYLEMNNPKKEQISVGNLMVKKQFPVEMQEYRNRYKEVGEPWDWANRLIMNDQELLAVLDDAKNEIFYCYFEDAFAGYFELDHHHEDVELVYFGLSPKFIGKGLGRQMIQEVFGQAEQYNSPRIWLHTCEFDSPQALDFYLKSGFQIYDEKMEDQVIIE